MIKRVYVKWFKRFEEEEFSLADTMVLAGPNNSGKTTLLQAISVWNLALQRWRLERGPNSKSKAQKRTGVPITRKDFTAIPLRELKLLWHNAVTAMRREELVEGQKLGHPRVLDILVEGVSGGVAWAVPFEFRYQNSELFYVKPTHEGLAGIANLPRDFSVVHVPPFSGIGPEETRYDRPFQDLLIGQGKPGDILRNLLLEVYLKEDKVDWSSLCNHVEEIFSYRLLPPEYDGHPYIVCEYLPGIPSGSGLGGLPKLDIASAGSGFLQVLLILGFLYARPATVLLLDEPDAHLHVILQKQIYDQLKRIATVRECQLIVATHSEVIVDATSPTSIISFYGPRPHHLLAEVERDEVREALKRLTAMDLLLAEQDRVLYVEGETDFDLLNAWARVLDHPLYDWLSDRPFWHPNHGHDIKEARAHYFALRAVRGGVKGYLLLDGDNRNLADREIGGDGLVIGRWKRYEAESYLIHPEALARYIQSACSPLAASRAEEFLREQLPPAVFNHPLDDHDYLERTPASKTLLPSLFAEVSCHLKKNDYYLLAEQMRPGEIPHDVIRQLDSIYDALQLAEGEPIG